MSVQQKTSNNKTLVNFPETAQGQRKCECLYNETIVRFIAKVMYIPSFECTVGHNQSHRNGMVPHECTELCFCSRFYYVQGRAKLKG